MVKKVTNQQGLDQQPLRRIPIPHLHPGLLLIALGALALFGLYIPAAISQDLPPKIEGVETFREGVLVFFRLSFTDPNNDAEGFGFRGAVWAEETHPFSNPSYGRVSPGRIAYPFNHGCGTGSEFESDVEAWIYDSTGLRSPSVTVHLACSAPESSLPPDPGEAGKATLEGIDSDGDGVRDDVQTYIAFTVTDSARHREALEGVAISLQRGLLAPTKEDAIQAAISLDRSIQCLSYLGVLNQDKWKEVQALMLNTEARLRAIDVYNDRITGQVFTSLPLSLKRSACTFDVEALPN